MRRPQRAGSLRWNVVSLSRGGGLRGQFLKGRSARAENSDHRDYSGHNLHCRAFNWHYNTVCTSSVRVDRDSGLETLASFIQSYCAVLELGDVMVPEHVQRLSLADDHLSCAEFNSRYLLDRVGVASESTEGTHQNKIRIRRGEHIPRRKFGLQKHLSRRKSCERPVYNLLARQPKVRDHYLVGPDKRVALESPKLS